LNFLLIFDSPSFSASSPYIVSNSFILEHDKKGDQRAKWNQHMSLIDYKKKKNTWHWLITKELLNFLLIITKSISFNLIDWKIFKRVNFVKRLGLSDMIWRMKPPRWDSKPDKRQGLSYFIRERWKYFFLY
jgi:hypothetical protein